MGCSHSRVSTDKSILISIFFFLVKILFSLYCNYILNYVMLVSNIYTVIYRDEVINGYT